MAKVKTLTHEEIEAKKEELKAKVNDSKKRALSGRSSPTKAFLTEVSDIIKDALKHNVSYKQLTKDIYDTYNFKVSEQTLRAFAQNVLSIEKQKRVKRVKNVTQKEDNDTQKSEPKEDNGDRIKSDFNDI